MDETRNLPVDQHGLEILDRETCLWLLAGSSVGQVGVSWRTLPVVLPVNFVLDGDHVVIRTGRTSLLGAALNGNTVAFEVDEVDQHWHAGWSVVVTGEARLLYEADEVARARLLPLRPWAPGDKDVFVGIELGIVSGRRLGPGSLRPT